MTSMEHKDTADLQLSALAQELGVAQLLDDNVSEDVLDELLDETLLNEAEEDDEEGVLSAAESRAAHLLKLSQYLKNLTPEQRAEMRRKADETRKIKKAYADEHYTYQWKDEKVWRLMAKEAGVRLADNVKAPTSYHLSRFARQLGLPPTWKEALFGIGAYKGIAHCLRQEFEQQPAGKKYNLRFYQGMLLECKYGATFKNDFLITDPEDEGDETLPV